MHLVGLPLSRPGWHGDRNRLERIWSERTELEMGPTWDRDTASRLHADGFNLRAQFALHNAEAFEEIPDLIHGAVSDRT